MNYGFLKSWSDFLPLEGGHVLAFSGMVHDHPLMQTCRGFYDNIGIPVSLVKPGEGGATAQPECIVLCHVQSGNSSSPVLSESSALSFPRDTTLSLIVIQGNAVGSPWGDVLREYHAEKMNFPGLSGLADHDLFLWEHLEELVLGEGGYLERVPEEIPVVLVISGLEEVDDSIGLFGFVGRIMQHVRLPLVVYCSEGNEGLNLKTAYRDEDDGGGHE